MNGAPNGAGGFQEAASPPALNTPHILSDLRLQELVGHHDRIMADLETPDPLVEAYTAGLQKQPEADTDRRPGLATTLEGIPTNESANYERRLPLMVGSLQELKAHLEHGRHQKELRERRQDLLTTMLREGMPLDVWVLTGDDRYVRLEQGAPASKPAAEPVYEESEVIEPSDTPQQASQDDFQKSSNSPSPPPLREHEKDDHQKEQQDQSLLAHRDEPSSTEEAGTPLHRRLLFYSVKREALDGLSAEIPAKDVEQVSRRIERFEALPQIRRFALIYYPFLIVVCLAVFWLVTTFFSASISSAQLGIILLSPLACVALLHFDSRLHGPQAIREHKRALIERHRSSKKGKEDR